jgi:hypothetical protein
LPSATPVSSDELYLVDDPGGTPLDKKTTFTLIALNGFAGETVNMATVNVTADNSMLQLDGSDFLHLGNVAGGGNNNMFLGVNAGNQTLTGDRNVCIGEGTGAALTTGVGNMMSGYLAGESITEGTNNVLLGDKAGRNITTSNNNFCLGFNAGAALTTTGNNVYIGTSVASLGTAGQNVGIGSETMIALVGGDEHTAVGARALTSMVGGDACTAVGRDAAQFLNTTGQLRTTALGYAALNQGVTCSQTTALGARAGFAFTQNEATMVGYNAASTATSARRVLAIGWNANPPSATNNYQMSIGNCIFGTGMSASGVPTATTNIGGLIGICEVAPAAKLHVKQESTTAAIPVLELEQLDTSEPFVNFTGTSGATSGTSITTLTTATIAGHIQIDINGTQQWIPYFGTPT